MVSKSVSETGRTAIEPPSFDTLPERKARSVRGGDAIQSISVDLEVVTPILGGSPVPRQLDDIDVIRTSTIRGHLRFWWRALYLQDSNAKELYKRESSLWGRAASETGGRSAVDIRVKVETKGNADESEIGLNTEGAYALWPARQQRDKGIAAASRRNPGTVFRLTLSYPRNFEEQVQNTLRAWILFGGYGGRTRRGLGSLTVHNEEQRDFWLPKDATSAGIEQLFGWNVFGKTPCHVDCTPRLAGATMYVGKPGSAIKTWLNALDWLKDFRQGSEDKVGNRAREPSPKGAVGNPRPSVSNWPEADKIRRFSDPGTHRWAHNPRLNNEPVWPRAGFGLPIVGRFQNKHRNGTPWKDLGYCEPADFEIRWVSGAPDGSADHSRLASPLITKALPLSDGNFVPCVLWLERSMPPNSMIVVGRTPNNKFSPIEDSKAPFDRLVAGGDTAYFKALSGFSTLRDAFFSWLRNKPNTSVVAP